MGIVGEHFHDERDFNSKLSSLMSQDIKGMKGKPPKAKKQGEPGRARVKTEGVPGKQASAHLISAITRPPCSDSY